ncbi:hypothetical protein A4A49_20440 [Nicotiana attenuata]|uniref:Uncharacterized protein n=1 Tax=Nicotiana attenuata TaxID=49451 RepID=A0A314KNG1_NICAT|nr:hypothetical protein A4A49_20440 [Nicotiana attenuata]
MAKNCSPATTVFCNSRELPWIITTNNFMENFTIVVRNVRMYFRQRQSRRFMRTLSQRIHAKGLLGKLIPTNLKLNTKSTALVIAMDMPLTLKFLKEQTVEESLIMIVVISSFSRTVMKGFVESIDDRSKDIPFAKPSLASIDVFSDQGWLLDASSLYICKKRIVASGGVKIENSVCMDMAHPLLLSIRHARERILTMTCCVTAVDHVKSKIQKLLIEKYFHCSCSIGALYCEAFHCIRYLELPILFNMTTFENKKTNSWMLLPEYLLQDYYCFNKGLIITIILHMIMTEGLTGRIFKNIGFENDLALHVPNAMDDTFMWKEAAA